MNGSCTCQYILFLIPIKSKAILFFFVPGHHIASFESMQNTFLYQIEIKWEIIFSGDYFVRDYDKKASVKNLPNNLFGFFIFLFLFFKDPLLLC